MVKIKEMQGKQETVAAGDLKRKFEDFGNRVRKKCIRRKSNSSKETHLTDNNAQDDSKSNAISVTTTLVDIMYSGTPEDQMKGVRFIRKLLSSMHPPIDQVIQSGLVPILAFLLKSQSDLMQYEAAWSLTNILSGTSLHVRYVMEAGAMDSFVRLLRSSNEEVQEQCAWALGNIAGDLDDFRSFALEKGAMGGLLTMIETTTSLMLLQTGAWAISNFCVGNTDFKSICSAIPVLGRFLGHEDLDFIYNCSMALAHLSDGKDRVQHIIANNIVPFVINLLMTEKECLMPHLLRILVNVSLGTEKEVGCLVKNDVLYSLKKYFESRKESLRYKATLIVANLSSWKVEYIDYIVKNTFVISKIVSSIGSDTSERVVKQAVYTLRNISACGREGHKRLLADESVVRKLCQVLGNSCPSVAYGSLICLENLLIMGERNVKTEGSYNHVALTIEECGGLENIEELQSHGSQEIYHKAFEIMENYFTTEDISTTVRPKFDKI